MDQELSYGQINDDVLRATRRPPLLYFFILFLLGCVILYAGLVWLYQTKNGMGVAGYRRVIDWGVYIANFVFWVGLAHSGTLISAIFFLVRARFRDAISRATEAMTIITIMIAGMFPMIHLGRFWVLYYIVPYPSQRQLWPNFISPLVWDVLAVFTYFTVSAIFFYVGLVPDLAAFRDQCETSLGKDHWKTKIYRVLSIGWSGAGGEWRHYGRSYLYFAALATPLVISVHTVVSWDFAMSLLKGWHTTIYAPYFVAGAIHSGLAMSLLLLIALRRFLNLKHIIRMEHLEAVAKTILVTTAIMAYAYGIEPAMAHYTGDKFDIQYVKFRATGWPAPIYWSLFFLNILAPASLAFEKARRSVPALIAVGVLVVIGMWLERFMLVASPTSHDYMPHTWNYYAPNWVDLSITAGAFSFFLFFYLVFSKTLPTIPISDLKASIAEKQLENIAPQEPTPAPLQGFNPPLHPSQEGTIFGITSREGTPPDNSPLGRGSRGGFDLPTATALYTDAGALLNAVEKVRRAGFDKLEFFSPVKLPKVEQALGLTSSPVRIWTLLGALSGLIGGFALAIGTADVNGLIVGGKHPVSLIPYCIVGFEGLILTGSLANLSALAFYSRFYRRKCMPYDPRYSRDTFALVVSCVPERFSRLGEVLKQTQPEGPRPDE